MPSFLQNLSSRSCRLPEVVFFELVDIICRPFVPALVMGAAIISIGTVIAVRKSDFAMSALTAAGVMITAARIESAIVYRRRTTKASLTLEEVIRWELRYAILSFAIAITIGAMSARALMMDHLISPMLIPMLITGLIFGYASGLVTRAAVRPLICVTSLMLAVVPTVIGFISRVIDAEGLYATTAFALQTSLIAGFALASLETISHTYKSTVLQLRTKQNLAIIASQDDLTGLPNRFQLRTRFSECIVPIDATDDFLAFHCLDLDRFKAVNDTYGHPMGDLLLQAVTKRLKQEIRDGDMVARLGGDEFAVLQLGIRHADEAQLLAHRIIRTINEPYHLDGIQISIGVSIGIAFARRDGLDLEELISRADAALYDTKRSGRGQVSFWEPTQPLQPSFADVNSILTTNCPPGMSSR